MTLIPVPFSLGQSYRISASRGIFFAMLHMTYRLWTVTIM